MAIRLLVLCLLLFTAPAHAKVFDPVSFTLSNGLQIVVISNHRAPIVSQMLWYKVGAADETPGQSGIAHYLEHLMFKGTKTVGAGEFSRRIAAVGGEDNAFTSWDYTAYFQSVAAEHLPLIMQLEADRMANLMIAEAEAKPELQVVLAERGQRTDDNPQGRFAEAINAALYVNHPYGIPIIGWRHEMEQMTATRAKEFYRRHYAPNNAVLVISGDVTVEQVKKLAEETYGRVPKRAVTPRLRLQEPPLAAERRITLHDSEIKQPVWQRVYRAPSWNDDLTTSLALEVLESILSDGEVGRLYKNLVVTQKLATGAQASYQGSTVDSGTFTLAAMPRDEVDPAQLEAAVTNEIDTLVKDGVTEQEATEAKLRLQRGAIFARDSLMAPGYSFGIALTTGRNIDDVEKWPERIGAVTVEQINAALRALFAESNFVTGLLLPDPHAPAATTHRPALMPNQGAIK